MNNIKVILIIVATLAAVGLGFTSYQYVQVYQGAGTDMDSIDKQLDQNQYCEDSAVFACYTEQDFKGTLLQNTLTVGLQTFTIDEDDETGPHLGKLIGDSTLVRIIVSSSTEEGQTLDLLEIASLSETFNKEQCVFGRYIFPVKGKTIEDPVFPLVANQAILELYPCFDSDEEKQYILEDLKIIYLDNETD